MTEMLLLLLVTLCVGILLGIALSQRRSSTRVVAGSAALVGLVLLPALAISQPGRMQVLPDAAIAGLGAPNYVFSINYAADDSWWVSVHPSAKAREGTPAQLQEPAARLLDSIEVYRFEVNSHCYTVVSGGKAYEVCPQH
jgi:hypothetical protein